MLVDDFIKELVQHIISKVYNSTNDWITGTIDKCDIFF